MKNRTRESCTSGSVRDEDGNILIYSAVQEAIQKETRRRLERYQTTRWDLSQRRWGCQRVMTNYDSAKTQA